MTRSIEEASLVIAAAVERAYRRGYRHGYAQCVNDIPGRTGDDFQRMLSRINAWRHAGDAGCQTPPPTMR